MYVYQGPQCTILGQKVRRLSLISMIDRLLRTQRTLSYLTLTLTAWNFRGTSTPHLCPRAEWRACLGFTSLHFALYIVLCQCLWLLWLLWPLKFSQMLFSAVRTVNHHSPVEIGPRVCPVAPVFHFAIHWTSDLSAGPASRLIACSEVKTHALSSCDSCDSCDLKSRICTI